MIKAAIHATALGKRYRIGPRQAQYKTLRESLSSLIVGRKSLQPGLPEGLSNQSRRDVEMWAVRDVSFRIGQGEIVGVIGRNGAGKSTLLKLLCRITEPTHGVAALNGRVGSLLEVGTGFHPELSGRDNVFMSGAILGMRKREITRRFDEIVAFAETERFIDTPVKHYSTGMYLRLAFAVAAHLEPEILLVDEVLAVGDAAFQAKCLGKMHEVAEQGRTVLFVSHNLGAVQTLCNRVLVLNDGRLTTDNTAEAAIGEYLRSLEAASFEMPMKRTDRGGTGAVRLSKVDVFGDSNSSALATGRPATLVFHFAGSHRNLHCEFTIYNQLGQPVTNFDSSLHSTEDRASNHRDSAFKCEIQELTLVPGRYRLNVALISGREVLDVLEAAAIVDVAPGAIRGRPVSTGTRQGSVRFPHRWELPQL